MLRKKILFYDAHGETKYYSLQRVLKRLFEGTFVEIESVDSETFAEKVDDSVMLLVIPGARAGQTYRDELGREHDMQTGQLMGSPFAHMMRKVQSGMNVLGICAGGFVLSKSFDYTDYDPHTGEVANKKSVVSEVGAVDTHAYGPDVRLYQTKLREAENPWTVYCAAHVGFTGVDGMPQTGYVALSKGPSFVNMGPECRPLVTFQKTGEAAMVKQQYGNGCIVLSGPAPEVGGTNLEHYVLPEHRTDPLCRDTVDKLEGSIPQWNELWLMLCTELLNEPERKALLPQVTRNLGIVRFDKLMAM